MDYMLFRLPNIKNDIVPEYLQGKRPLADFAAFYFNWHTDETSAPITAIQAWFTDKHGWELRQV